MPHFTQITVREWIALMLTLTICVILLVTVIGISLYPPGSVPEGGREALVNILSLIIGILSGFVAGRHESPPTT